jgi:hypothetical protein
VNAEHLFLGTVADNNHDRHRKGRSRFGRLAGADHPSAHLTTAMAAEARAAHARGETRRSIARRMGVADYTIVRVIAGVTYK